MARSFRNLAISEGNWYYKTSPKRDFILMYLARKNNLRNRDRNKSKLIWQWSDEIPSAILEPKYNSQKSRIKKIKNLEKKKKWAYLQKEKVYDLMSMRGTI
ncbi:MAG: hypothetical protein ACRCU6_01270 [Fusobacteriaceae bacterium]